MEVHEECITCGSMLMGWTICHQVLRIELTRKLPILHIHIQAQRITINSNTVPTYFKHLSNLIDSLQLH